MYQIAQLSNHRGTSAHLQAAPWFVIAIRCRLGIVRSLFVSDNTLLVFHCPAVRQVSNKQPTQNSAAAGLVHVLTAYMYLPTIETKANADLATSFSLLFSPSPLLPFASVHACNLPSHSEIPFQLAQPLSALTSNGLPILPSLTSEDSLI